METKSSGADIGALDARLRAYCEENKIFGVLRVTQNDRVLYRGQFGYANLKDRTPFTEKSMFSFYSLSKPFCVTGLLKLKDRGLVDLDAHPGVYVPEARGFDGRVTIRQMLRHVSGLPDFLLNEDFAKAHAPGYARYIREHLKLLARYPQYFAPGTAAKYENINMVLCALIVENLTGEPYAEYMKKEVFTPLGMKSAAVDNEDLVIADRVRGYALAGGVVTEVERSLDWMLGGGDIVGTVDDVYALNGVIKHGLLLAPDTWRDALTPSPLNNMGMGCTITVWHGKKRVTHNGGHTGFRTLHIQLPEEDFDIIFLSNSGYGNARHDLSQMIYETFFGPDKDDGVVPMDTGYIGK